MDSITQFTLGASIGEAVYGKKIGARAPLIGGIAGTIPDLDVLLNPFFDEIAHLVIHRGYSHSLLFGILAAIPLGLLAFRLFKNKGTSFKGWYLFFMLCLITHALLDSFTTYGTQLLLPFSDYRVAFNNIYIVDPFYTIPFLLSVIICLFIKRSSPKRRLVNWLGIGLSCSYLLFSFVNKGIAHYNFNQALTEQGHKKERMLVGTTPLNIFLWYCMVEQEDGYLTAFYSTVGSGKDIEFHFIPRNDDLLENIKDTRAIKTLKWFSKGYYHVEKKGENLLFYSINYGRVNIEGKDSKFIFPVELKETTDGVLFISPDYESNDLKFKDLFSELLRGIKEK